LAENEWLKIHQNVEDVWYPKTNRDCVDEKSERKRYLNVPIGWEQRRDKSWSRIRPHGRTKPRDF